MNTTFTKVGIAVTLFVFAFGVFGYVTSTDTFINQAQAVVGGTSGCGDCGGGTDGGSGGGTGGGNTPVIPAPTCDIQTNISSVAAGDAYTITWTVVSPTVANVYINGAHVNKTGSATYNFRDANNTETFRLTAQNAGGSCNDTVVVTKTVPNVQAPTCDIRTNISSVAAGDAYTISWTGTPTTGTTFRVNGTVVAPSDSATYNFRIVNNTETYTMTATNAGGTCTDEVTVTKIVPQIKTCDVTASATSVATGGSVTLTWATQGFSEISINGEVVSGANGSKTYTNILVNTTYTLTARTADGTGNCTATVTVVCIPPVVLPPVCVLNASPTTIDAGNSSRLTWTSQNAVTGTINQGVGAVTPNNTAGFRDVSPSNTTTYTMTVTNSNGVTATCARTITVTPVPEAPICNSFTASPSTITSGGNSTLTWNTTNANTVTINNGVGGVAVDGSTSVSPLQTVTYTLTAVGANNQQVSCPVTVTVSNPPEDTRPVCESFTASPNTLPNGGGNTTLTWNTSRASNVSISPSVGSVATDGSRLVSLTQSTTYTLTARDADNDSDSCTTTVTVTPVNPPAITCSANVSFNATQTSIDEGESTTLNWSTSNITSVRFDQGISATGLSGSVSVNPTSDRTYTLTASDGTDTISCPITINVDEDNGGGGGGTPTPRCELKISDRTINRGDRVTLTWDTTNATEVELEDNHGKTLITTDGKKSSDKKDLYDGEITLRPDRDTTYTLLAERGSKDRTCTVKVAVKDSVVVLETRDQQPLVTGIALTQVPYTGFEAGPFLTVMFYTLLALWALYLAYFFVIRPKMGMVPATAAVVTESPFSPQLFAKPVTSVPNFHPEVAPTPVFAAASTAVVGYESHVSDEVTMIENRAHASRILLSGEAIAHLTVIGDTNNLDEILTSVFAKAKASYPSEEGWVVINLERLASLLS